MTEHRSIGEVLTLLQEDFPEVTVSKIRFLESQGLIAPERTPSGYRKFYSGDVDRLRWILEQQRDHYLPLKVIKGRLAEFEADQAVAEAENPDTIAPVEEGSDGPGPSAVDADEGAEEPVSDAVTSGEVDTDEGDSRTTESGAALTREELARVTGLDERTLKELDNYGIMPAPRVTGDQALYDEEAVVIGRLARGFIRHGVEPRHLRMYKTFGEREAGFVGQLVNPILKKKSPEARREARETVAELARLGGGMRAAMLRLALRDAFDE